MLFLLQKYIIFTFLNNSLSYRDLLFNNKTSIYE